MKIFLTLLLPLLILLGKTESVAFTLNKKSARYSFHQNVSVFCDRSSALRIEDIEAGSYRDSFRLLDQENRFMGNPGAAYWIRIPLLLEEDSQKQWLLEFFDFRLSSLSLFNQKKEQIASVSHYDSFEKRNFTHKNFVFPLIIETHAPTVYYARIQVDRTCYLSGMIRSFEDFNQYSNEEYFFLALFYGILLTLILYNLVVYFSIRDSSYIYYSFYIFFVGLVMSSRDNIGFQFLWHDFPLINKYLFPVAETALILFAALYAIRFLDLKNNDPFSFHTLRILLLLRCLLFLMGWIFKNPGVNAYEYDLIPLFIIACAGIKAKIRGYKPADFYLAGFGFILTGFLITICIDKTILPSNAYTFYSLNIGVLVESFFLSLALGSKLQVMYKEKEKSQRKALEQMKVNEVLKENIHRELEEKVKQRTTDLNEKTEALLFSNKKLKDLSEQLNELNAKLDLDNWKLNQEVKEKTKEQILSKELSFLQFSEVFPEELSCLRYLEEIKWNQGFTCKKCGHSTCFESGLKFSRKCSRCDYIETVKAHTIFQGVKFPLQKSFYILYLISNSKRKVTLKELSETLQLRMNTCSVFRKKVERKKEKMKTDRWEELVLE